MTTRQAPLHLVSGLTVKDPSADPAVGMSKRGDAYLRTLLVHGARSVIYRTMQRNDPNSWLAKIATRRHKNIAIVAQANKTARIAWALLARDQEFRPDFVAMATS